MMIANDEVCYDGDSRHPACIVSLLEMLPLVGYMLRPVTNFIRMMIGCKVIAVCRSLLACFGRCVFIVMFATEY